MNYVFMCVFVLVSTTLSMGKSQQVYYFGQRDWYPAAPVYPVYFPPKYELYVNVNLINMATDLKYEIYETDCRSNEKKKLHSVSRSKDNFSFQVFFESSQRKFVSMKLIKETRTCKEKLILGCGGQECISGGGYPGYFITGADICTAFPASLTLKMDMKDECPDTSTRPLQTTAEPKTRPPTARPVTHLVLSHGTLKPSVPTTPKYENIDTTTNRITASDTKSTDTVSRPALTNVLIHVIPILVVMCVIITVIYISIKKYCQHNSRPGETMELNTYSTANQVLYADLSLAHGDKRPLKLDEETPYYVEIIGVLKPVDKNLNNKVIR